EPLRTDTSGYFSLAHVAPGRVAFIAVDDAMAPSNIEELAVVDGGVYQDLELHLDRAGTFSGLVIDQDDQPLAGVKVEVRPMDRGRGAEAMKMALRVRRVRSATDKDGRFTVQGVTGRSLMVTCQKRGYTTEVHFGVRPDQKDLKIKLSQGVTVRGRVQLADGTPVSRFSVQTRTRGQDQGRRRRGDSDGARGDVRVEVGSRRGRRSWGREGRGRWQRSGSRSLPEGSSGGMGRGRDRWQEFRRSDGVFVVHGLPPGKVEVRVRADGYLDPERQTAELAAGQESEELTFQLQPGAVARGMVLDEATGEPIANATVTAYREREQDDNDQWRLFRMQADPEDFDFLGLAAMRSQRTVLTDSQGRFELKALEGGHKYRFTARHPDLAKASVKEVEVRAEGATENIQILLGSGGAMEGLVTGAGRRPLGNAMVIAFCPQSGTLKSSTTNKEGYYRIDGLPPGQYFVFKTRMDEKAQDIGLSAMANMRMKMKPVRRGKVTRVDIHDESEDGVRVFGVVREQGNPIPRAMITFLGRDREGILGMGIRAQPTDDKGSYELAGIKPGDYLVQVSRFRGRPEQTSLTVEIPEGARDFRYDIDLPDSYVAGRVQDSRGNPLAGITVQLGIQGGGESVDGMLGLILRNGVGRARTDKEGNFKIKNVAAGTYRLTASGGRGRGFGRRGRGGNSKYGDTAMSDVNVNGVTPVEGLVLMLPLAGSITGTVVDGSGNPVANAQINYVAEKPDRSRRMERAIGDLFGLQRSPVRTGADGRFTIPRVTPGKYRVRAEIEGLAPGTADDVVVLAGQPTDCQIGVVKGAKLKIRVTNIDGSNLPLASISVFDSKGKPLASKVSVVSVFRKLMRGKTKRDSSGWHEIGSIPPDTYTVVIQEKGQPDIEVKRTIHDGEEARWDINMAEELKRHRDSKKK
ncbi:MAG: carboxypeptidase regulatory-like domain-containing protein, partial [Planctomycetota bacterium]